MFFTPVLILNMQRLVATSENSASTSTKEINKAYEASDKMLPAMNDRYSKMDCDINESKIIMKIMFDSSLENVTFPIKMQSSWPSKCGDEKYEIQKKDMDFNFYMDALHGYKDENVHSGKKEAVRLMLSNLAEKTKQLHSDILFRNHIYENLNFEQIENIIKMSVNIKLNAENNLIFEQVFINNDYKEITKSIEQLNICHNVIKNTNDRMSRYRRSIFLHIVQVTILLVVLFFLCEINF
ncbi:putative SP-containing protein [Vairimorpha necatrix]|uniref:SP-containing protein n=1 Tax=Vairimorpha necatrix TaxID=6039 RepID=A0AAX4J842_9MICR